jgi:hypothetical protein
MVLEKGAAGGGCGAWEGVGAGAALDVGAVVGVSGELFVLFRAACGYLDDESGHRGGGGRLAAETRC